MQDCYAQRPGASRAPAGPQQISPWLSLRQALRPSRTVAHVSQSLQVGIVTLGLVNHATSVFDCSIVATPSWRCFPQAVTLRKSLICIGPLFARSHTGVILRPTVKWRVPGFCTIPSPTFLLMDRFLV